MPPPPSAAPPPALPWPKPAMSPAPAGRTDSAPPIADPNGADGTPPPPPPPSDAALTATSPDSAAASRPADVSCAAVSAGRPPPGDPVGGTIGAAGIPVPGVTPEPSDGGIRKPGINPCSCGGGGGSILMAGGGFGGFTGSRAALLLYSVSTFSDLC